MFEINPRIADADSLFQRVVNTAKSRQIADEFYGGELKSPTAVYPLNMP